MVQTFVSVLGFGAAALGCWITLPQAVRAIRTGTAGVSPATFQMFGAVGTMWFCYGLARGLAPALPGNFIQMIASAVVLIQCRRHGRTLADTSLVWIGSVAVVVPLFFIVGATWVGWLSVAYTVSIRIPQFRSVMRRHDISGVSLATWSVAVVSNALWGVYGVLSGDAPIAASGWAASASSILIVVLVHRRRTRSVAVSQPHALSA